MKTEPPKCQSCCVPMIAQTQDGVIAAYQCPACFGRVIPDVKEPAEDAMPKTWHDRPPLL